MVDQPPRPASQQRWEWVACQWPLRSRNAIGGPTFAPFRRTRSAPRDAGSAACRRCPADPRRPRRRQLQAADRERPRAHPRGGADAAGDGRLRQCHPLLHRGADQARRDAMAPTAACGFRAASCSTTIKKAARNFTLHGQDPKHDMLIQGQARALRHGRCGRASGRCREARIPRIAAAGHLRRRAHRRRARQHPFLPAADGAARHSRSARYGFQHALRLRDGHLEACRHVVHGARERRSRRSKCSTRSPAARRISAPGRSSPIPTASSCRR